MAMIPNVVNNHVQIGGGQRNSLVDNQQCSRCGIQGVDLTLKDCRCSFHVRCVATPLHACPVCKRTIQSICLLPMSFEELDEARKEAAQAASMSGKRENKRKTATIARLNPEVSALANGGGKRGGSEAGDTAAGGPGPGAGAGGTAIEPQQMIVSPPTSSCDDTSDLRTGRWTTEEMAYCDQLIDMFANGRLPVADGTKLNDFLASMLKSKQSRLTKKMKNAKLSTKSFRRTTGYIALDSEARKFSEMEDSFFKSITCSMERAEIRFHVQKEWRELYSTFCVHMGQKIEAHDWLTSVEEMDRRVSQAKDAARMARRKKMMGYALRQDTMNPDSGVFIERSGTGCTSTMSDQSTSDVEQDIHSNLPSLGASSQKRARRIGQSPTSARVQPSPFLGRVVAYMERHSIPFEHVDAWVPSYVGTNGTKVATNQQKCRLCFAGCGTADLQFDEECRSSRPLGAEDKSDLQAFGDYSQKFSFEVGCGLPGRVYQSGIPSWEQNVQSAPHSHFERCGGAKQWKIRTVLGVPIPSPNVGRVVILLYSRIDRHRNQEMVGRIVSELTRLMPTPKWKLVVDIAPAPNGTKGVSGTAQSSHEGDSQVDEMLTLLQENMPQMTKSSGVPPSDFSHHQQQQHQSNGFAKLRRLLLNPARTSQESEMIKTLTNRFVIYSAENRPRSDVALMLSRDYMLMTAHQGVAANQPQQQGSSIPQLQENPPSMQQPQQQQQQHHQKCLQSEQPAQELRSMRHQVKTNLQPQQQQQQQHLRPHPHNGGVNTAAVASMEPTPVHAMVQSQNTAAVMQPISIQQQQCSMATTAGKTQHVSQSTAVFGQQMLSHHYQGGQQHISLSNGITIQSSRNHEPDQSSTTMFPL